MSSFSISRREALLAALSGLALACKSSESHAPAAARADSAEAEESSAKELAYATGGDLGENERGGTTVVMLHGFGASADDLVALARTLVHSRTRYIVPAGPIELPNGGHAWWPMQGHARYDENNQLIAPSEKLAASRAAVLALLTKLRQQLKPDALVLLGFSQGAMLALDVGLSPAAGVDRVAVLSGALLADTAAALASANHATPNVFVSHGRQDPVLRFQGAQHLVKALKQAGVPVRLHAFDGGHEIPEELTADLKAFVNDEN